MNKNSSAGDTRLPLDPPADSLIPDAMAVVDAFANAYERGEAPPLSEWLSRYPEHSEALADYAAAMLAEPESPAAAAGAEQVSGKLSPGTQRALDMIFNTAQGAWPDRSLPRVAETSASYDARVTGILALAEARGLDVETLAEAVDLSPQLITWLDRTPIREDAQPYPLVRRLAQALGVGVEQVARALAVVGDSAVEATSLGDRLPVTMSVEAAIRRATSLSVERRAYWLAMLNQLGTGALERDGDT